MPEARPLPFIGVRQQENRTPSGRRTSAPARRAAQYVAYGRDQEARVEKRQRGVWLGPDSRAHTHTDVLAWVKEEAMNHRYTFTAVLSAPRGDLTAESFNHAMQQGREVADWRLMLHRDTAYRHAHLLFFRDQRLDKETFLTWQADVRAALVRLIDASPAATLGVSQDNLTAIDLSSDGVRAKGQEVSLGW